MSETVHHPSADAEKTNGTDVPVNIDARDEALFHAIARLKLRLEVCLRRERDLATYTAALSSCLEDVDDIMRAALFRHLRPRQD